MRNIILPLTVLVASTSVVAHSANSSISPNDNNSNSTNVVASPQQQTQTIKGTVVDAESKAPIPGIKVAVMLDDNKVLGGITDAKGRFSVKNVPIGRRAVRFTGLAYQEQMLSEVIVSAGKEVNLQIALTERVVSSQEAEVVYDRSADAGVVVNDFAAVSARAFALEDTKKYAGSLGDPSRMAQNFAGVVGANDSRNDIVVRGNSPLGMLWQLEGVNIPNPNHFGSLGTTGGPVSILNNNTLDKSDFFSGAFPAQYGNAFAGVFDLNMRNGNFDTYEFIGQVGFNGFEVGAEGPMGITEGSSFLVNYRYSTLGVFKELGVEFGTGAAIPNYQDVNMKLNIPLGKDGRVTVFGIGGKSDIAFLGNEQDTTEKNLYGNENENTRVDFKTGIAGVSGEWNISPNTFAKLTLAASATEQNFEGDSIDVETRIAYLSGKALFRTQKYSAVGQLRHKFDAQNTLVAGFTVDREQFSLKNTDYEQGGTVAVPRVAIEDGATLSQAYTQFRHRFTDKLSATAGVHLQHYSLGDAFAVEPRAGLQYSLPDGQTFSLGYGLHSQTQPIYNYFVQEQTSQGPITPNINMDFTRSHHFSVGYDYAFAEQWRLKAEAYYQYLFDVPVSTIEPSFSMLNAGASFAPTDETFLVNSGTGTNVGVELTLEKFFGDGFYMLATGSLFDSKYKGFDDVERNTAFNMGYVANILAGKEWDFNGDIVGVNVRLTTTGGRYITPLNLEESRRLGYAVYHEDRAFSERQTPYFRADVKLYYRMEFGSSTLEFAIDLQNVSNNQNIFQQSYNRRTNSIATEYQQGFFPVPTLRYTF